MTLDISSTVQDAMLDAIETAIGTAAVLKIRTGAPPGIGNADSGTVLATLTLPSDWMGAASSNSKAKAGTWSDTGVADGTAGHFRLYASDGTTQHVEGTITITSGGGDLELDNTSIATGQTVTVSTFTLAAGN